MRNGASYLIGEGDRFRDRAELWSEREERERERE